MDDSGEKNEGLPDNTCFGHSAGAPASGLRVVLFKIEQNDRVQMADITTNADGRTDAPILPSDRFEAGVYELIFHAVIILWQSLALKLRRCFWIKSPFVLA